ncbi:MAG TPA: murein biosynthesis integral membrane protein MurJ [Thermoleophilaceae bacterium]
MSDATDTENVTTPASPDGTAGAARGAAEHRRHLVKNTAFYSAATGMSRIAGLVREIVAASKFGVTGPMSAFTIAYQVPNVLRALFAEGPLQAGFVPVFTELLERGERREAWRVASVVFWLICLVMGALTAIFVLVAPVLMPLFAPGFKDQPELQHLTTHLAQIVFLTVPLLGLSGLLVGMLYAFDHFAAPAIAPLAWNVVVIGCLIALPPLFPQDKRIYAYAIGILGGTIVQLLLPMPWLRGRGGRITLTLDWRNEHVRRVLKLMLPVTIALGIVSLNLLVDSFFATFVSKEAPAAIDRAFRLSQLPQGLFSVAIATVIFPTLARHAVRGEHRELRHTMANGIRQICLLLIPAALLMIVLAVPSTRLVYQRGEFTSSATHLVSQALVWWAVTLPFEGMSLLYSRTFFSLQRTWITIAFATTNLVLNAAVAAALHGPFGISGVVLGTVVGTAAMTFFQMAILRRDLGGVEGRETASAVARMLAAGAVLAGSSWLVWHVLDSILGRSTIAQIISLGAGIAVGIATYAIGVLLLKVPEAGQIQRLVAGRLKRSKAS